MVISDLDIFYVKYWACQVIGTLLAGNFITFNSNISKEHKTRILFCRTNGVFSNDPETHRELRKDMNKLTSSRYLNLDIAPWYQLSRQKNKIIIVRYSYHKYIFLIKTKSYKHVIHSNIEIKMCQILPLYL